MEGPVVYTVHILLYAWQPELTMRLSHKQPTATTTSFEFIPYGCYKCVHTVHSKHTQHTHTHWQIHWNTDTKFKESSNAKKNTHTLHNDAIRAKEQREELKWKKTKKHTSEISWDDVFYSCGTLSHARTIFLLWGRTYLWTFPFEPVLPSEITYNTFLLLFFFSFSEHTPIESPFFLVA